MVATGMPRFFARRIRNASEEFPRANSVMIAVKTTKRRPRPAIFIPGSTRTAGGRGRSRMKKAAMRIAIAPGIVAIQNTAR